MALIQLLGTGAVVMRAALGGKAGRGNRDEGGRYGGANHSPARSA